MWVRLSAYSERGQAEVPGPTSNPRISDYLRSVNSDQKNDNDVDWSSAFVNWSLKQVGISGTNSIDNSSWTNWGKSITEAKPGCIAIFSRPSVGNDSRHIGHVGFYVE